MFNFARRFGTIYADALLSKVLLMNVALYVTIDTLLIFVVVILVYIDAYLTE